MEIFWWLLIVGIVVASGATGYFTQTGPLKGTTVEELRIRADQLRRCRNITVVVFVIGPAPFAFLSPMLGGTLEYIALALGLLVGLTAAWVLVYSVGRIRRIERALSEASPADKDG